MEAKKKQTKKQRNNKRVLNKIAQLKKAAVAALYENMGNASAACAAIGIGRSEFYKWQRDDKDFAEAIENVSEFTIDQVENKLLENINKGDTTAIIFFLKCRAKKRGYVERQEVEHSGSMGIVWEEKKNYITPESGINS